MPAKATAKATPKATEETQAPSAAVTAKVAGPKMHKCKVIKDHECLIGTAKYSLKKDQELNLPEDASGVLQAAGIVVVK